MVLARGYTAWPADTLFKLFIVEIAPTQIGGLLAAGAVTIRGPGSPMENAATVTTFLGYFNFTRVVLPPLVDR